MKISGLAPRDLFNTYLSLSRPVCEYACQVWATSLTTDQWSAIESIQRRALKIFIPRVLYRVACESLSIALLGDRRGLLCVKLFDGMKDQKVE